ncbi:F-box/kelch-repeat protein At3g23880-like [Argentina anserina]|uniref:F-box/kelch-repeat protein At3g23880-like n=1 Tax=Argentina anserina TaxID=57926 RepID=UPI002176379B|nr:F-box/kelch-repeat protein At3g23880-like [Potentilla anserina]
MVTSSLKRKQAPGYSYVEPEIVRDILSLLPVKALKRFQCVSKPWQAMIRSMNLNRHRLLCARNPKLLLSIDYEALSKEGGAAIKQVSSPDVAEPNSSNISILGSCCGLVLLEVDEQDDIYVLWNPSTRETMVFPRPAPPKNKPLLSLHGVGYDPSAGDYKVVYGYSDRPKTVTEVFAVKTHTWRTYMDLESVDVSGQGCYLNGAIHWIKLGFMSSTIVSFNLKENTFERTLSLPDNVPSSVGIGVTKNRLFIYSGTDISSLRIWVMNEFGVRESWTRVLRIPKKVLRRNFDPDEHGLKPLCILETGEVLFAHDDICLLLYDPKGRVFQTIVSEDIDQNIIETVFYEESLESLPAAEVVDMEE